MAIRDVKEIVDQFAYYIQMQEECMKTNDWKTGNKYAKKYIKCFSVIKKIGDSAKEEMKVLLLHDDLNVRGIAAAFLLNYCTEDSLQVLKELSQDKGIRGLGAKQTIKNWENGDWHLDD